MLNERTKQINQERSRLAAQALADKMSRLTHRKPQNPKQLLNELTTGDKNVTFKSNNHSTAKATSSEGKNDIKVIPDIHTNSLRIGNSDWATHSNLELRN